MNGLVLITMATMIKYSLCLNFIVPVVLFGIDLVEARNFPL